MWNAVLHMINIRDHTNLLIYFILKQSYLEWVSTGQTSSDSYKLRGNLPF